MSERGARYGVAVPIVAAVVCPSAPVLVPEISAGAAGELDELRAACGRAVDELVEAEPDVIRIVGGAEADARFGADATGSFAAYGIPQVTVRLGSPGAGRELPLPVLMGGWMLEYAGAPTRRDALLVDQSSAPGRCLELGAELARDPRRIALLVIGDGSARRGDDKPLPSHPAAHDFDDRVASALRSADREVLAGLDPVLAEELAAAGRAAWQVLAGATAGRLWSARLLYSAAPYGVGYFVAVWRSDGSAT